MTTEPANRTSQEAIWTGVITALVFPAVFTWLYFVLAADWETGAQRAVGVATKTVQFVFPLVWVWLVLRESIGRPGPRRGKMGWGVGWGLAFGVGVTAVGWVVFEGVLRALPQFATATDAIQAKLLGFGIDTPFAYLALGVFYSLAHSFLEEYYWRWFVFGQLRRVVPVRAAIVVSALGFTAHHVIVLGTYFGPWPTVLLSAAVTVGGVFWAWLYQRSGSLVGPWLSHLVIDAGIFAVGYQLLHETF